MSETTERDQNAGTTEIVCVVDKSGSMDSIRRDAIGGFNTFLTEQKKEEGEARFTLALFDTDYERVWDGAPIDEVEPLDEASYRPGGQTALLDAVGRTIHSVRDRLDELGEAEQPDHVIFVILTDGLENSSREYVGDQVPEMIRRYRDERGWEFMFLAANIDAFAVAERYNIDASRVSQFAASAEGVQKAYQSMGTAVTSLRRTGHVTDSWADEALEEGGDDDN
jgi:hypothetical protein